MKVPPPPQHHDLSKKALAMIGGSFWKEGGEPYSHTSANVHKYTSCAELTRACISVTSGGGEPLMYIYIPKWATKVKFLTHWYFIIKVNDKLFLSVLSNWISPLLCPGRFTVLSESMVILNPNFRNRVMTVQYVNYLQFGAFVVKSLLSCSRAAEPLYKNSRNPADGY